MTDPIFVAIPIVVSYGNPACFQVRNAPLPVENRSVCRRETGRFSTGKKRERQEAGRQHVKGRGKCIYFSTKEGRFS